MNKDIKDFDVWLNVSVCDPTLATKTKINADDFKDVDPEFKGIIEEKTNVFWSKKAGGYWPKFKIK